MTIKTDDFRALWPRGLSEFLDYAASSHRRACAMLAVVCLLAFLPGFFQIPPVDRDEARFAQATKQMIESGDYIDIRFQDDVRYKKPVGIYWMQAVFVKAADALGVPRARTQIAIYRIPSLIGAIGGILLTYWAALAFVSRRAAVLAASMLAVSILVGVEAHLAKTDAMLFLTIAAAMGAMGRVYLAQQGEIAAPQSRWALPAIFWTAVAAGILLKGPLILMIVGLTVLALVIHDRSARWLLQLRPGAGLLWVVALVLPWFVAIIVKSGNAFFSESVGRDLLGKLASGQESHGALPGYYLVLFFATFWPASILSGLAAPSVWRQRREPATRFLLAWLIPSWIVFELVVTKLPHYVLPLYPAIAILIAGRIDPLDLSRQVWLQRGTLWWFITPVLVGLGGIIMLAVYRGNLGVLAWPFVATAIIFGFRAWWLYETDGAERSLLRAGMASIFLAIAIYAVVIPSLRNLFPSVALARTLRNADCANPIAASAGFQEPSLVFLAGTGTRLTDPAGAAEFLRQGQCRFAFIDSRMERSFAQRADAIGLRYKAVTKVDGFSMGSSRPFSIAVFQSGGE